MYEFYNYANLVFYALSALAFGGLAVVCLGRLGETWALFGLIGGTLTVLANLPGIYRNLLIIVRPSPELFDSQSLLFDPRFNLTLGVLGTAGAVLCAAAVLLGRRPAAVGSASPPPPPHAG